MGNTKIFISIIQPNQILTYHCLSLTVTLLCFVSLSNTHIHTQLTQTYTGEITKGIAYLPRCFLWSCVFRSSPLMWHLVPLLKFQRELDQMSRRNQMRLFVGSRQTGVPRLISPCAPLTLHRHPLKLPLLRACHAPTCDLTRPKTATSMSRELWSWY